MLVQILGLLKYNVRSNKDLLKYKASSNSMFAQIQCWFKYKFSSNTGFAQIQCWFKNNVSSNTMLAQIQG